MNMKKIQRWIKSITLTILMISTVTWVSAKTSFLIFQSDPQTNSSPDFSSHTQDINWNPYEGYPVIVKIKVQFLDEKNDEKNLRVFYKREDDSEIQIELFYLTITLNNHIVYSVAPTLDLRKTDDFYEVPRTKWKWTKENFYDYTLSEIKKFNFQVHLLEQTALEDEVFNFPLFNFFNINHLFPTAPDYENLRIEKKSDASGEIFYAIDPTAPATVPAGYNFDFTRLEAEYASAGNPDDVQSIELSFNAQRQAYSAVLDNLESETDYVINRLIWHYTLTDQSDSSKSYSLFSDLPLPAASNSFNLNNLDTDVYVIAAVVEIAQIKTDFLAFGGLADAWKGSGPQGTPTLSEAQTLRSELITEIQRLKTEHLDRGGLESAWKGSGPQSTPTLSEAQALVHLLKKSELSHSPSSNNDTLIIGVSAGVGGALLLGGLGYWFYRRRQKS